MEVDSLALLEAFTKAGRIVEKEAFLEDEKPLAPLGRAILLLVLLVEETVALHAEDWAELVVAGQFGRGIVLVVLCGATPEPRELEGVRQCNA